MIPYLVFGFGIGAGLALIKFSTKKYVFFPYDRKSTLYLKMADSTEDVKRYKKVKLVGVMNREEDKHYVYLVETIDKKKQYQIRDDEFRDKVRTFRRIKYFNY